MPVQGGKLRQIQCILELKEKNEDLRELKVGRVHGVEFWKENSASERAAKISGEIPAHQAQQSRGLVGCACKNTEQQRSPKTHRSRKRGRISLYSSNQNRKTV